MKTQSPSESFRAEQGRYRRLASAAAAAAEAAVATAAYARPA